MPADFEKVEFYRQVEHYFVYEFGEDISMLAYVQWVGALTDLGNGLKAFRQWGAREVINVSAVDRCVGFFKLGLSQYVIIDHERQVII